MPVAEEWRGMRASARHAGDCFPLAGTGACTDSTARAEVAACSHLIHSREVVHMCIKPQT